MTAYVEGLARVSVPATSANLGPGFDSLGLALDLRDRLEGRVLAPGETSRVEIEGEGATSLPRDASHLVLATMRRAFVAMDCAVPPVALRCHNVVPHARGLGSSSAAIVGALGLARALVVDGQDRLDDAALLDLAATIEGHPDNVAPALLGGFVVAGRDDEVRGDGGAGPAASWWSVSAPVDARVSAVALVPPGGVLTEVARGLLPAEVGHATAAADAGRAALLVAALGGQVDQLWRGTRDHLHQEHRRAAMPHTLELVDTLRAEGVAALVSGAGPTVLALVVDDAQAADVLARAPAGWAGHHLRVAGDGLVVHP